MAASGLGKLITIIVAQASERMVLKMTLNNDDTESEQYIASMHRPTDVLLNCERCQRLFYADYEISKHRYEKKIPLLCLRCRHDGAKA